MTDEHDRPLVRLAVKDGVATITMDSPHNRNALSAQLRRELRAHIEATATDDEVRVVVLTHSGPVFCAGMDLKESRGADADDQGVNEFPEILELLWTHPKPVVARLSGPTRAGGVGIVAACDIAVAADDVTFAFTEVRIGVIPAVISVTVLPRLLPRAAHELFLTGETIDARRAVAIGLINSSVPPALLNDEVERYTDMLALGSPAALSGAKELLRRERCGSMREDFAEMLTLSAAAFAGAEGQEGMRAFAEKRSPSWVPKRLRRK